MAQQAAPMQVRIDYGHNDTHVLVRFSQKIDLSILTIEQAEAMRASLGTAVESLRAHQAKKAV